MSAVAAGVLGWRCAVCGTTVDIAEPLAFTCPRTNVNDRRHVLHPLNGATVPARIDHANPFVAYGPRMAWWAFARAHGMTEAAVVALATDVADGFEVTPFTERALALGAAAPTPVWVKDETGNVGGSHKSRHLVGILLHLRAAAALGLLPIGTRPSLAIASCGNAAIAAATLAQQAEWPLHVYVPDWASPAVLATLEGLGASITVCERRESDPAGDPAVLRFRDAVDAGALPFSVQGPENGMCLDGGRTIGWEMADAVGADGGPPQLDRVVVQVGGGALATCAGWGLGSTTRLDTVQAQGCAPLARAWWRSKDLAVPDAGIPHRWSQLMTPWDRPHSLADGILDDETYDWLGVFDVMRSSGGEPLVAPEEAIVSAATIGTATGIPVSATGAAGVAGLLVREGRPADGEQVSVIFSGVAR
jgi:threonine synthase